MSSPASESIDTNVLRREWLQKKGKNVTRFFYFVLKQKVLTYYTSSEFVKGIAKKELEVQSVLPIEGSDSSFIVTATNGNQLTLIASNADSCAAWIMAIEKALVEFKDAEPLPVTTDDEGKVELTEEQRKIKEDVDTFIPSSGTSVAIPDDIIEKAGKEVERVCAKHGYAVPDRGDLDDSSITWREGKPNYSFANLAYLKGKSTNHAKGSLEMIAENLVKTWEMEASHKPDLSQWSTINYEKYHLQSNEGRIFQGEEAAAMGNYNFLLSDVDKSLYDSSKETFESSHHHFRSAFPRGFPWELLEVFAGPPKVAFSWRHWGQFSGEYKENKGNNEVVEMFGFLIATVDDNLKICKLEVFYEPETFIKALKGDVPVSHLDKYRNDSDVVKNVVKTGGCPMKNLMGGAEADSKQCPFTRMMANLNLTAA